MQGKLVGEEAEKVEIWISKGDLDEFYKMIMEFETDYPKYTPDSDKGLTMLKDRLKNSL